MVKLIFGLVLFLAGGIAGAGVVLGAETIKAQNETTEEAKNTVRNALGWNEATADDLSYLRDIVSDDLVEPVDRAITHNDTERGELEFIADRLAGEASEETAPSATITPESGEPASMITYMGSGFSPGDVVVVLWAGEEIGTSTANEEGNIAGWIQVPDVEPGEYEVNVGGIIFSYAVVSTSLDFDPAEGNTFTGSSLYFEEFNNDSSQLVTTGMIKGSDGQERWYIASGGHVFDFASVECQQGAHWVAPPPDPDEDVSFVAAGEGCVGDAGDDELEVSFHDTEQSLTWEIHGSDSSHLATMSREISPNENYSLVSYQNYFNQPR